MFEKGLAFTYNKKQDFWELWQITFCNCGVHACKSFLRAGTLENMVKEIKASSEERKGA